MNNNQFLDTLEFSHQLYDQTPQELAFKSTNLEDAEL